VDPGYDANDTLDGNLTASVSITGSVDVNSTGTYTLNYSVSDTAGNQADINRTVNVAPMGPWIFTSAGATGRFGPTQAQIDANYSGTSLEGAVTINATHQGIQEWTVPVSGTYRVEVLGAKGGGAHGGRGAKMSGLFSLNDDSLLYILVGQHGISGDTEYSSSGGGGSFVTRGATHLLSQPLVIAGGGGGSVNSVDYETTDASITNYGKDGSFSGSSISYTYSAGKGGDLGYGGKESLNTAKQSLGFGGAGFYAGLSRSDLQNPHSTWPQNPGPEGFLQGGSGASGSTDGTHNILGGFGGGGSAGHSNGGGGGYTGGGWGSYSANGSGGGGGSFNSGTNQDNQAGVNEGHGKVIITYIGN
jgi:hypothetical protein